MVKRTTLSAGYGMVCCMLALAFFWGCNDDNIKAGAPPSVTYPTEVLYVDLNALQPPIICVIRSETGLKSVAKYIVSKGDDGGEIEEKLGQDMTEFYSATSCSVREAPLFMPNMLYFKVVAIDLAGQTTVSTLPFEIVARAGLPVITFTYDEAGEQEIAPPFEYVEGSEIQDIFLQIQCDTDLNEAVISESTSSRTREWTTISFEPGQKQATINLSTLSGSRYEAPRDILSLSARVTAGALNREREAVLRIYFNPLLRFTINEDDDFFNGLALGSTVTLTGVVDAIHGVETLYYTLLDRAGASIESNVAIAHVDGAFEVSFAAISRLGAIRIGARDRNGNEGSREIPLHVGYRYDRLLAGPVGGGSSDSHGLFLSSQSSDPLKSYCDAKAESAIIEAGLLVSGQENNGSIRLLSLDKEQEAFNPTFTDCGMATWSSYLRLPVGESSIVYRDFDKAGIDDFKDVPIVDRPGGVALYRNMNVSHPSGYKVAIFEGATGKRVLLAVEKLERHDPSWPAESTFYIKIKIQL